MAISTTIKGTRTQRDYNRQLEREYLNKLYEIVEPGKEFKSSYLMMAELTQVPSNIVSNVMKMMDKEGVLKRRFRWYGGKGKGAKGGREAYWTILTSKEHADNLLAKYQESIGRPRNVIPLPANMREVNPFDNDSPIAQAKVWANKCRAYMKASDLIRKNLEDMKAVGIQVDEDAYLKSINVAHDERLSAIALVMPYIESLEKRRK